MNKKPSRSRSRSPSATTSLIASTLLLSPETTATMSQQLSSPNIATTTTPTLSQFKARQLHHGGTPMAIHHSNTSHNKKKFADPTMW
ncbi:hypothetical protein ACA910_013592 [Epithemia clementina (nom. ined.)]